MSKLLSICIPTYNRITELSEVIHVMLQLPSDEIEIVITDNCSTDETESVLRSYRDERIRYFKNERPLSPFMNMIHSIFNGSGKYALYCNDRDLLYPDGVQKLIEELKDNDLAFLWGPARSPKTSHKMTRLPGGYRSLMKHVSIHHPTGMVFNRRLMAQFLNEADYEQFIPMVNTYDILMLDLMQYGKTGIFDGGYWSARPAEYFLTHASKTAKKNIDISDLYFSPKIRERMFYGIVKRMLCENNYGLDREQRTDVLLKVYSEFGRLFCKYKACMWEKNETAHYGIPRRFVTAAEVVRYYSEFFDRSLSFLRENGMDNDIVDTIFGGKSRLQRAIIIGCLKIDAYNLYRCIK